MPVMGHTAAARASGHVRAVFVSLSHSANLETGGKNVNTAYCKIHYTSRRPAHDKLDLVCCWCCRGGIILKLII